MISLFGFQTAEVLQAEPDSVFQQDQEMGGHVQPVSGLPGENRAAGAKLRRLKRHLQKVPANFRRLVQKPDARRAETQQVKETEVSTSCEHTR